MTARPRVLNPYCGVGGTTRGLQLAGFYVIGVDIAPQPDYCGDEFYQGDAIEAIHDLACKVDAICAEPPCQNEIAVTAGNRGRPGWIDNHRNWINPTRIALNEVRKKYQIPTVIECGVGKHIRRDLMLCADMFYPRTHYSPRVQRHRWFEIDGLYVPQRRHRKHIGYVRGWRHGEYRDGPYVAVYGEGGGKATIEEAKIAMGIDWTDNRVSLNEAIPPVYTEYIGGYLFDVIQS